MMKTAPARGRSMGWSGALCVLLITILIGACSRDRDKQPAKEQEVAHPQEGVPLTIASEDGVPIRYRVYGTGEPALIFIHCWACDSSYWDQQIEPLKTRYTVVTLDLAGHGESGTTRG